MRRSTPFDKKVSNAMDTMSPMVRGDYTLLSAKTNDFFHTNGNMDSLLEVLKMFSR